MRWLKEEVVEEAPVHEPECISIQLLRRNREVLAHPLA
jgi:hypothetical protein